MQTLTFVLVVFALIAGPLATPAYAHGGFESYFLGLGVIVHGATLLYVALLRGDGWIKAKWVLGYFAALALFTALSYASSPLSGIGALLYAVTTLFFPVAATLWIGESAGPPEDES